MLVNNQKGDTIVEVLIALAIIGSVIVTSSLAVDSIGTSNSNNYLRQQAVQVLQNQMELIKAANSNIPEYSLKNIFYSKAGIPSLGANTSNNFCAFISSIPSIQFNIDKTRCKFDQSGVSNTNNLFYSVKLNLVQATPSSYYNLQGEVDWTNPGQTSSNNVKLTYELVSSN